MFKAESTDGESQEESDLDGELPENIFVKKERLEDESGLKTVRIIIFMIIPFYWIISLDCIFLRGLEG